MKKALMVLLSSSLVIMLLALPVRGESLIINGYNAKPPKYYVEDGQSRGILVDMVKWIGAEIGYDFDVQLYPWSRAYQNALDGNGGIIGLSWTEERDSLFDYSDVMYYDDVMLVVRKDKAFSFDSLQSLKGKSIALERGSSKGEEFDQLIDSNFVHAVWTVSQIQNIRLVLHGRADIGIVGPGEIGYLMTVKDAPDVWAKKDQLMILPKSIVRDPNYFGISKKLKAHALLEKFNQALEKGNRTGVFKEIINNYSQKYQ